MIVFRELHRKRTAGEPLEKLKILDPTRAFNDKEFARKDKYVDPYWGKS
jgi:hypothetical protein